MGEECDHVVRGGGEVDGDVDGGLGEVAAEVGDGGDLGVGDDVEGAVTVADFSAAEGHGLDDAGHAGEADGIADVELVFNQDEGAVENVFDDGLGGEADGYARYTR